MCLYPANEFPWQKVSPSFSSVTCSSGKVCATCRSSTLGPTWCRCRQQTGAEVNLFLSPSKHAGGPTEHLPLGRKLKRWVSVSCQAVTFWCVDSFWFFLVVEEDRGWWVTARQQTPLVSFNWVTCRERFGCSFAVRVKQEDQCVIMSGCHHEVNKPQKQRWPPEQ